MSNTSNDNQAKPDLRRQHPFRSAVLRGLGVVLPPLLTIVILVWVWMTVRDYVLVYVENGACKVIVLLVQDIHDGPPGGEKAEPIVVFQHQSYERLEHGQYVPKYVLDLVRKNLTTEPIPKTGKAVYQRYVELRYLSPHVVIPVFLCLFILILYLLGKFLAAGVGRMLWNFFEQIIHRVPIIRTVYSSVKQVTDFVFSESEIQFNRVVAVEYPRKGIWSVGFVTGESMLDISSAANESVLSVLVPTSPMPVTGFTITVRRSETIDLDITVDQAVQFIVSCGVVVPLQQMNAAKSRGQVSARIHDTMSRDDEPHEGESSPAALTTPSAENTGQS